jgi:tetratricopeptide (TPR) repeat protein
MSNFNVVKVVVVFSIGLLIVSCSAPQTEMRDAIHQAELKLLTDSTFSPDAEEAKNLITLYDAYAKKFPADTLSAEYLFKAGEISVGINNPKKGIEYYSRLYEQYPSFSKAPVALFLQGFIYENQLGDLVNAKLIYEKFLELYPNHPIANDVTISLENLGKSPEELIQMFQDKQNANDSLKQVQE